MRLQWRGERGGRSRRGADSDLLLSERRTGLAVSSACSNLTDRERHKLAFDKKGNPSVVVAVLNATMVGSRAP
ncbi:hypothetical protein MHYP_G00054860 [Metynnis hypsauchen]